MDKRILGIVIIGISISMISVFYTFSIPTQFPTSSFNEMIFSNSNAIEYSNQNPLKVGILHSLSGTMSISETPVVDSTLLAIEELNQQGGILGREIVPIIYDGKSDWPTFAKGAEYLIVDEEVSVVFGGWTSASRKTMKPIFEEYDHLLFYPVQYEGLETSPNIIYTGAAPNQQVIPAVTWAFENLGNKFYLVGSDYVFPRSANEIMKASINEMGGKVIGEDYEVLGSNNFETIVSKIKKEQPDVILNTINGDSNVAFFKELRKQGITPELIPTISFSIAEDEIRHLGADFTQGDYASWNYFQSIETIQNKNYVENFQKKYGPHRVTDDPMEAGYIGVYLYAKAVENAGTDEPKEVLKALKGLTISAPEGTVGVDPENQHLSKGIRIGKILSDGQFQIVSSSEGPIKPNPYPDYKTQEEWETFLNNLYYEWDENWANPSGPS